MTQNKLELRQGLRAFSNAYNYDVAYLEEILESSMETFLSYRSVQSFSSVREKLPLDAHFVARIVTMQVEDCGACVQLSLKMAVEAGVERTILQALLQNPEQLPAILADVRAHVLCVVGGHVVDKVCLERLKKAYGAGAIAEMSANIAGSRIYPTLKRSLGYDMACQRPTLDF